MKFDIPAPGPPHSSQWQSISSSCRSYKGLCLRTFLQVPQLPNSVLILQDVWGRICLWGSMFSCVPGALAYPEPCRSHLSLPAYFPLSPSLSSSSFRGLTVASGLLLGVYVPNEYSNPTSPLFPHSPACLTARCGLAWFWPHVSVLHVNLRAVTCT